MKNLLPLLILINTREIIGVLEWTVTGKVTDYGQNVTLFCHVPNCCPKDSGWDRWTPNQRTLFIDVKTGRPNKKYDGKVMKDGYTLVIQNLTKQDLNVSYSCLYGVTLGEQKLLLKEDVFANKNNGQTNEQPGIHEGHIAGIIVVVVGVIVAVAVVFSFRFWRRREIRKSHFKVENENKTTEDVPLIVKDENSKKIDYPGPPNDLKVSKVDESEITIEWGPPSTDDGSTVGDYKIYIKSETTGEKWIQVETVGALKNDFTFTQLKANDKYYIGVAASNKVGDSPIAETDKTYSLKEQKIYFLEDPSNIDCVEGNDAVFTCKICSNSPNLVFMKENIDITKNVTNKKTSEGIHYELKLMKTKLSDSGEYSVQVGKSLRKVWLNVKEKASIDEINTYMKAIEYGSEVRQYVRIQVIGKDGVGKTSLVHRLLGYEKHDGKSTDGVEVNRKCQIKKENGEWIVGKDDTKKREMIRRILQASNGKQKEQNPVANPSLALSKPKPCLEKEIKPNAKEIIKSTSHVSNTGKEEPSAKTETVKTDEQQKINDEKNYISVVSLDNSEDGKSGKAETLESSEEIKKTSNGKYTKPQEQMPDSSSPSLLNQNYVHADKITEAMIDHMGDIISEAQFEKDKMTSEGLVECGIWDFAGQKDYYATHQTFFTPHAIYILVADIIDGITDIQGDADFNVIGEYIGFWFDSIHCFCTNPSEKKLCPPVVMVCTGIDKDDKNTTTGVEERISKYDNEFLRIFGKQEMVNHKRGRIFYISNKYPDPKDIVSLKDKIREIAAEMNYFSEKRPTRWINLENALEILKDMGETVYSWTNILKLAYENSIEGEELVIFLNYHHKIGNIIFFDDKPDYIILQPNWLVKCFRCLVCDDKKHSSHTETEMFKLKVKGELSETILDELFEKHSDLNFGEYKPHILDVMEKFDIIIKPQFSNIENKLYYMPCMIETSASLKEIKGKCFTAQGHCTPWLVLEFEFLPVAYYNHILFDYIRQYTVCEEEPGHPAIYKGKAVVYLDDAKSKLLIICFSKNAISVQIWEWSDGNAKLYENILREICGKIDKLEDKLLHNLHYKIKAKCSIGDYSQSLGRISYEELTSQCKEEKYNCKDPEHKGEWHNKNEIENTWLKYATAILKEIEKKKALQKKSNVNAEEIGNISKVHLNQETYPIRCGIAVVINNTEVKRNLKIPDRVGSDVDAASLYRGFQKLGFKTERLNNTSKEEMENKFDQIKADKRSLEETDCLIIALMTHCHEEEVYLTNGSIKMKTFLSYFNAENCKELQLKPKVFIIQACGGIGGGLDMEMVKNKETYMRDPNQADAVGKYFESEQNNEYEQKYGEPISILNEADVLVVYSTSFVYVHHLSEELMNISKDDSFYQVLTRVNKKVGMEYRTSRNISGMGTRMPCFSSRLTKQLFFNLKGMAIGGKQYANNTDSSTNSSITKETERNSGQGIINKSHLDQTMYTIRAGRAVVISNTEFDAGLGLSDRIGSDGDAASLLQRFMELGFESDILSDATFNDLEEKFQEIKDDEKELQKTDCLIVAVLSHGDEDSVYMTDKSVKIKAVMDYFNAQNCPELILKPKIFIFECSFGQDSSYGVFIPNEADFLAVYSMSLGYKSYGNTEGSFVSQLIKELHNMKKEDDVYTVLTKVNNKVITFEPDNIDRKDIRQMPYFVSHLTKDVYLKS